MKKVFFDINFSKLLYFIFVIILNTIISQKCEEGKNYCIKCDYRTNFCAKCQKDIFGPDENGKCEGIKKCSVGNNYCLVCEETQKLCKTCENGYIPDENGGCSYSNNCDISLNGKCLKCKEDFVLTGENSENNFILCKSKFSDDFKNCEEINSKKGICEKCQENFYLNKGDNKCIQIENCFESSFGLCKKCIDRFYYDKKENKCKKQEGMFYHCQQSIDGKICDICDNDYYLAENGKCGEVNYCLTSVDYGRCEECKNGYFLIGTGYKSTCTITDHCSSADKDTGLCLQCMEGYYIDIKDGLCKSSQKDDNFKYCRIGDDICLDCNKDYYLGEDNKCTNTEGCIESEQGICSSCLDSYYYGLDKKCSLIEHCIYSLNEQNCLECEDNYCYNRKDKKCFIAENQFKNCKTSNLIVTNCFECKDEYYLNQTDNLCYSNKEFNKFYKCAFTDSSSNYCFRCIKDYYLGSKYNRCSIIQGCEYSEDEERCIECNENYCLNVKTGKCEINNEIKNEDKKYYFRCNRTNLEGNKCEICMNGFTLNEDGLCIDKLHCKEEKDGKCIKCSNNDEDTHLLFCLNNIFDCVFRLSPDSI